MSKWSVAEDYILHKYEKMERLAEMRDKYLNRSRQITDAPITSQTNNTSNPTEDDGIGLASLDFMEKMIKLVNDLEEMLARPETESEKALNKNHALERKHMLLLIECRREYAYSGRWYVKMPYLLAERQKGITMYSYSALYQMWERICCMCEALMWERGLK